MKVIAADNFDRDTVDDRLIQGGLTEAGAAELAAAMNRDTGPDYPWFYRAVPDEHPLHRWEP